MVKDFGPLINLAATATNLEKQRKAETSKEETNQQGPLSGEKVPQDRKAGECAVAAAECFTGTPCCMPACAGPLLLKPRLTPALVLTAVRMQPLMTGRSKSWRRTWKSSCPRPQRSSTEDLPSKLCLSHLVRPVASCADALVQQLGSLHTCGVTFMLLTCALCCRQAERRGGVPGSQPQRCAAWLVVHQQGVSVCAPRFAAQITLCSPTWLSVCSCRLVWQSLLAQARQVPAQIQVLGRARAAARRLYL